MFWGDPPRTQFDLNFWLFGIPVRIHPLFWVVAILLGTRSDNVMELLAWTVAVFVSILIHEFGHALAMRAYGFHPWITLHGMGGLTSYQPLGTYHTTGHSTFGQVSITAAGPAAGFLLAALVTVALRLSGHAVEVQWLLNIFPMPQPAELVGSLAFTVFLWHLLFISVVWGLVNLLPVYPLDGGQIAREVLLQVNSREGIRISLLLSLATAIGMAIFAATQWESLYTTLFFAYLAYASYSALQSYMGRGPF